MLTLPKLTTFLLFVFLICSNAHAQNSSLRGNTGFITFNFDTATYTPPHYQKVSLFGCNTTIMDSVPTKNPGRSKPGKVLSNIPAGWQIHNSAKREKYYVSKYYVASPPVMKNLNGDTIYAIGIVTPDEFEMIGEKPVQKIYMDYNILKPVYIEYLTIEFDSTFNKKIPYTIPFRVEAIDFPWLDTNGITGAKGASGIGYLQNTAGGTSRLFLPYYYSDDGSTKNYLNFRITILNDILFHEEVYFYIDKVLSTSINLAEYKDGKHKLKFSRKHKAELPCGCKEPERAKLGPVTNPKKK